MAGRVVWCAAIIIYRGIHNSCMPSCMGLLHLLAPVRSSVFKFSGHPNHSVGTIAANQLEPWSKPNGYVFHFDN